MRSAPRSALLLLGFVVACAACPAPARAGAWTTWLRAEHYTDLVARGDTVWCASLDGGLQRFVVAAGRFEDIQREPGALASQALSALEFDRSGRLWVGTRDQGIFRLSPDGRRWDLVSELDGLPGGMVESLRAVGDTILIGTEHGFALWNGSEIAGTVPEGVNPSPFASDVVTGVVLRGDTLWVATAKGLYISRPSAGLSSWTLADTVFATASLLALAWDGVTLMTVVNGTALAFDPEAGTWVARSGIGTVAGLSDDRSTILAISNQGLFRWDGTAWQAYAGAPGSLTCAVENNPACHGVVVATLDDGGRLWAANRDGLLEWTGGAWTLHTVDAPAGNNVQNIVLDGGRVYIATYLEGVGRFDGAHWRNWVPGDCTSGCDTTFVNPAYAFGMLVDRQGRKWVGNWGTAMESFDDEVSPPEFRHYQISDTLGAVKHTFLWCADTDTSGARWFGMDTNGLGDDPTPIGIEYYDAQGTYRANYRPENTPGMPDPQIRALHVHQRRNMDELWVGYHAKGVTVSDLPAPGGPLVISTLLLPNVDIFGLAAYGDSIWVLTTSNLHRFDALSRQEPVDPLLLIGSPATRGACHPMDVGPDGTVWVGTDGGVHAYAPGITHPVEYTFANSPLAGDEVRAIRVDPASGVVWIGTATGLSRFDPAYVPPPAPELPSLEVVAYPNPQLLTGAGLRLRLLGNATIYHGAVYDVNGRQLHRFEGDGNGEVFWDGRDASGQLVRPGVYFVRVEAGGRARTVRVALLR